MNPEANKFLRPQVKIEGIVISKKKLEEIQENKQEIEVKGNK